MTTAKSTSYTSWGEALPTYGVVPFLGIPGSGKSATAWYLFTTIHEQMKRPVIAWGIPKAAQHFFPSWVIHMSGKIDRLQEHRGALVFVDEAAIRAPARRSQSDDNLAFITLNPIARQAEQLIFYIAQHTKQVDVGIIGDSGMTVFKLPSELHVRLARKELQPEVKRARDEILRKSREGADYRSWSYVVNWNWGREGLLKSGLPKWWTEGASAAFSFAQAGELDMPAVKGRE